MNDIVKRILISVVSLVSVFIFPWWVLLVLASLVVLILPFYVEMIVVGYWLDVLYGLPGDRTMLFTFIAVFLIVLYIKKNLILK